MTEYLTQVYLFIFSVSTTANSLIQLSNELSKPIDLVHKVKIIEIKLIIKMKT